MQLKLDSKNATFFSGILDTLASGTDSPGFKGAIEDLKTPFLASPVVVDAAQVFQLQALLAGILNRSHDVNAGFSSDAIKLMENLLVELSAGEKLQ